MANRKLSAFFQMDRFEKLNAISDSTISIIKEAIKKNIEVWVGSPNDIRLTDKNVNAKGYKVLNNDLKLGRAEDFNIKKFNFFFIRQDPPFDLRYLTNCYILEIHKKFNNKPYFINDPNGIKNFTEKIFPLYFSELMPKTYLCEDEGFFLTLLKKHKNLVLKTLYNKGGEGVEKVSQSDTKIAVKCFNSLINDYSVPVVIQEFLEDVKFGDKRVILLEGSPVGVINRIPTKGEFKANLHLGGKAEKSTLTKKEQDICKELKPILKKNNLFLVGIDLIGGMLTEINVTSPTGINQINLLYNLDLASMVWKILKKKYSIGNNAT